MSRAKESALAPRPWSAITIGVSLEAAVGSTVRYGIGPRTEPDVRIRCTLGAMGVAADRRFAGLVSCAGAAGATRFSGGACVGAAG